MRVLVTFFPLVLHAWGQTPSPFDTIHVLALVEGSGIQVKYRDWAGPVPAFPGMLVRRGDFIAAGGNGSVTVVCGDLSVHKLHSGILKGIPCPATDSLLKYDGRTIQSLRSGTVGSFPTVISPRATKLISPRPRLQWAAPQSAAQYQLTLHTGIEAWTTTVSDVTETEFPRDWPDLKPGHGYRLTVSAAGESSDQENAPFTGFELMPAATIAQVVAHRKLIADIPAPDDIKRLIDGYYLLAMGALSEALASILGSQSKTAAIQMLEGEIYIRQRLPVEARRSFKDAFGSASKDKNIGEEIVSAQKIVEVNELLGNRAEAEEYRGQGATLLAGLGQGSNHANRSGKASSR